MLTAMSDTPVQRAESAFGMRSGLTGKCLTERRVTGSRVMALRKFCFCFGYLLYWHGKKT